MHLLGDCVSLHNPTNVKLGPGQAPAQAQGPGGPMTLVARARLFFKDHGHKLWWLHSAYALALGIGVVFFARAGLRTRAGWPSPSGSRGSCSS